MRLDSAVGWPDSPVVVARRLVLEYQPTGDVAWWRRSRSETYA